MSVKAALRRNGGEDQVLDPAQPARQTSTLAEVEPVQPTDFAPGLSLANCRRHLESAGAGLSDVDVALLHDQIYDLVRVIFAVHPPDKAARASWAAFDALSSDERVEVEERAAVLEFDAGMTRADATRSAMASHLKAARFTKPGSSR